MFQLSAAEFKGLFSKLLSGGSGLQSHSVVVPCSEEKRRNAAAG